MTEYKQNDPNGNTFAWMWPAVYSLASIPNYWIVRLDNEWWLVVPAPSGWAQRRPFAPSRAIIANLQPATTAQARGIGIPGW